MDVDEFYMQEAIKEALLAQEKDEVPVGAIIVYKDEIIARAHNQVEELNDALAHAETLCIRQASKFLNNWRLLDATLYCTLEPCHMCAGALILSRINTIIWGAPDLRHGAGEGIYTHPIHQPEVRGNVLAKECGELLSNFFKKKREPRSGNFAANAAKNLRS